MDILRRFKSRFVIIAVICIIAGFGYVRKAVSPVSAIPADTKTVIIDPGHGGLTNTINRV